MPTNWCWGSVCFYQAAGKGQLSFNGGVDICPFFFFFASLHSDVLYGSYYPCYPRPELIWHHELVGEMSDLFPFNFFFVLTGTVCIELGDYVLTSWSHQEFLMLEYGVRPLPGYWFTELSVLHLIFQMVACLVAYTT